MQIDFTLWVSPAEVDEVAALVPRMLGRGWRVTDRGPECNGRLIRFVGVGEPEVLFEDVRHPTITNYAEAVLAVVTDVEDEGVVCLGAGERAGLVETIDTFLPPGFPRFANRERHYARRRLAQGEQGLPRALRDAGVSPRLGRSRTGGG